MINLFVFFAILKLKIWRKPSFGGAHVVTGVAQVSALVVVKEITDMPAKVCDAWFIESLRNYFPARNGKPTAGAMSLQYDSDARFRQIKSAIFSIFFLIFVNNS